MEISCSEVNMTWCICEVMALLFPIAWLMFTENRFSLGEEEVRDLLPNLCIFIMSRSNCVSGFCRNVEVL